MAELNMWLVAGGLGVGAVFGLLIQRFRFCMVAATGNFILIKDNRQVLAFVAAILVAISGTQILELTGTVAIADSAYRNSQLDWLGASLGGIIFGIGAVFAGGCATRTLIRSAEGSSQAIIALLAFMLFAAFAQFGFLENARINLTHLTAINLSGDAGIGSVTGLPNWLSTTIVIVLLLGYMIKKWNPDAKEYGAGGFGYRRPGCLWLVYHGCVSPG